jgi:protein SCO1/2
MNLPKTTLMLLGAAVLALGISIGTFLWLKLAPRPDPLSWGAPGTEGLNNYGPVPDFTLVEQSGEPTGLADMRGRIWIADFIYTTCTDTCPMQSAAMAKLQEKFANQPDLRLVSFSVDPERDTPEVLTRYAARFNADTDRWLFLTGDREVITRLVQEGFRLSAAALTDASSRESVILHSPRFVLIDRSSDIRGYYDSRDQDALERLKKDTASLLEKRGNN